VNTLKQSTNVAHAYGCEPDDCVRPQELLLKRSVCKEAVGPTPEPDDRDGTKVKEDSANVQVILQHP
jgi:hypothetical protein